MSATYCFSVHAEFSPASLPRVVEVFALHGLVPWRCHSNVTGRDQDDLVIDAQIDGLAAAQAAAIAKRLGRIVTVKAVLWSAKITQLAA